MRRALAFSILAVAIGCGDNRPGGDSGNSGDSGDSGDAGNTGDTGDSGDSGDSGINELPFVDLDWNPCAFVTGSGNLDAECATVTLPGKYDDPDNTQPIDVFVKRQRRLGANGQIWFLNGGPGGTVTDYEPAIDVYALRPDLDYYFLEHRGVGDSTRLGCPDQEDATSDGGPVITSDEAAECAAYVVENMGPLDHFTTTGAAYDLATLIEATRAPSDEVFIYGVSYGTYWLHRYLHIAPGQADGLIFDSVCAPGQCDLAMSWARGFEEIGHQVLNLCAFDATCSTYLPDPAANIAQLYEDLDAGHCSEAGLTRDDVRRQLAAMVQLRALQPVIPAFAHRLIRCSAADVAAIDAYFDWVATLAGTPGPARASGILFLNIKAAELFIDPTPEDYAEIDTWLFNRTDVATGSDSARAWPAYARDAFYDVLAPTDVPILMLQGDYDPQTPPRVATRLRDHWTGPNQTYIEVPFSVHNVVVSSARAGGGATCGQLLMEQFLADPTATLDDSCTGETLAPDFDPEPAVSQVFFARDSLWE